ncbi:DegT/DnrJ/EryC1/StrS family aminotransferase [Shewanella baltica]|uniref:DegT/DnrJ/EryC1/StrS family aminotransferase n=1 Tax=Shewanella baltica TaxID=62322 RepID=UPI00217E7685|nr:DegT/DnrJ/EryC1/StrS family aminotransferase [Shewanella baltica]MCS6153481.1 DegT/DnrJ/EryC1/StrS family aminotransferase [Shewanella baltica]
MQHPIFVTQPMLAPLEEVTSYLKEVWNTGILTHNGPLVKKLELDLIGKLDISNIALVTNGTIALQIAIRALELKGEIITTPFSWVATVSAIKWEGCTPIFCDIDSNSLNIDVNKIESLITENTVAIMPVHVFGNPCEVEKIHAIAEKYGLKVIYDAAHAVGTKYKNQSVLLSGDISAISLHGTKLFNTAEGGACISNTAELHEKVKRIRFFGHDDNKNVVEDGLNGKLTEVHAALGLANLKYFDDVLRDREYKYNIYKSNLSKNKVSFQKLNGDGCNFSYFPIIFENEKILLKIEEMLNNNNIFPRRYFYPSLNLLSDIVEYSSMPISESVSKRILCLPLYYSLSYEDIEFICNLIIEELNKMELIA